MHRTWTRGLIVGFLFIASAGCPDSKRTPNDNANDNANTRTNVDVNDNDNVNLSDNINTNVNVIDNTNDNTNDNSAPAAPAPEMFSVAANCAACHNNLTDTGGNDVSIANAWRGTMMANAARDPYFIAKVSSEIARRPALAGLIEDTCARCHMPMAHTQLAANGQSATMFGEGLLNTDHPLHDLAIDGVSCVLCHQIEDTNLGETASFSGGYVIDATVARPDRVNYGPYADSQSAAIMQLTSGYLPVQGTHLAEAAVCATCHTLFTPYVNAAGELADDLFPEQTAFLEWRHSEYGDGDGESDQTCQQCHMPPANAPAPIASVPANLTPRSPFAQHHFVGGNTFMLEMMKTHRADINAAASEADFDAAITRTLDQLQQSTANLSIRSTALEGDTLTTVVRVENRAGHKLPTGFPARRAWIRFRVADAHGAVVFDSGAPQADGTIAGADSDTNLAAYEPHHTTITSAAQVQIYQSIMKNTDDAVTYTLLRAAAYAKDNRLLPRGFDKATAGEDFAVVGAALTDPDFVGGSDDTTYRVALGDPVRPLTITAELLYQSIAQPFVEDIRDVKTAPVERFVTYFDAADHTPIKIASVDAVIE